MRKYKVLKGTVGPWNEGQVITEDDLKENPGLGGTKRLVDELKVLEETYDSPAGDGKSLPAGRFVEVTGTADEKNRSPALTTGHAQPNVSTAATADDKGGTDPNVHSHGRRGRS